MVCGRPPDTLPPAQYMGMAQESLVILGTGGRSSFTTSGK